MGRIDVGSCIRDSNTYKHTSSINKLTQVDKKGSSTYFTIA